MTKELQHPIYALFNRIGTVYGFRTSEDDAKAAIDGRQGYTYTELVPKPAAPRFAVHFVGPDDVLHFDDELEALRVANDINKRGLAFNSDKWDAGTFVLMFATVSPVADA